MEMQVETVGISPISVRSAHQCVATPLPIYNISFQMRLLGFLGVARKKGAQRTH